MLPVIVNHVTSLKFNDLSIFAIEYVKSIKVTITSSLPTALILLQAPSQQKAGVGK